MILTPVKAFCYGLVFVAMCVLQEELADVIRGRV